MNGIAMMMKNAQKNNKFQGTKERTKKWPISILLQLKLGLKVNQA